LGGALAVGGEHGPAVGPDLVVYGAEREHRLDGEGHARLHGDVHVGVVEVRHDQAGVERGADAVAGEVANDAVAEAARVGLDDTADGVEGPAGSDGPDAAHHGLVGALDEQPGLLRRVAGQEGGVGVAVHAADVGGDVDVDDVTVGDDGVVGDAVADDLVERGAQGLGVAAVAERAGVGAVVDEEFVADAVELVGGDAGLDVVADLGQGLGGDLAGHPHALDGLLILDLGLAGPRVAFSDVLGPGDARGYLAHGREPAGLERCRHDLGV